MGGVLRVFQMLPYVIWLFHSGSCHVYYMYMILLTFLSVTSFFFLSFQ